jgi:hypothetical protein
LDHALACAFTLVFGLVFGFILIFIFGLDHAAIGEALFLPWFDHAASSVSRPALGGAHSCQQCRFWSRTSSEGGNIGECQWFGRERDRCALVR